MTTRKTFFTSMHDMTHWPAYLGKNERTSGRAEFRLRHKPDIRFQLVHVQRRAGRDVRMAGVGRRQPTDSHVTRHFRLEDDGAAGEVGDAEPAACVGRRRYGDADMVVADADQTEPVLVT